MSDEEIEKKMMRSFYRVLASHFLFLGDVVDIFCFILFVESMDGVKNA